MEMKNIFAFVCVIVVIFFNFQLSYSLSTSDSLLLNASKEGNLELVKTALENGVNLDIVDDIQLNGLMYASSRGFESIVDFLLVKGANVNFINKRNETALIWAAYKGNKNIALKLLKNGAKYDKDFKTSYKFNYLMVFSACGLLDLVKELVEQGADVNEMDVNGVTPLLFAVRKMQTQVADYLIKNGAFYNNKIFGGKIPFLYSIYHYKLLASFIVDLLVGFNANNNSFGNNAFISAAYECETNQMRIMLEYGVNINSKSHTGFTALMLVLIKPCRYNIAKELIEKGADINLMNDNFETALTQAIEDKNFEIVKILVEKGAIINIKDSINKNPLFIAIENQSFAIFKYLVEKGANIYFVNENEIPVLMYAGLYGNNEIFNFLLSKGLKYDKDFKVSKGANYLMAFSISGMIEKVKELIEAGANVNDKTYEGETALMLAVSEGRFEIVKLLVEKGADINAVNDKKKSVIQYTQFLKSKEIYDYLKSKGAKE